MTSQTMQCDILTLFPDMVEAVLSASILERAREKGLLDVRAVNLRDYAEGRHKVADDYPYGGGAGMVIKPEPVFRAVEDLRARHGDVRLVLMTPQGRTFTQAVAAEFATEARRVVFISGHYEGIDERVRTGLAPEELSIGDYILTGGELAALIVVDAAARLIPGVVGDQQSAEADSFADSLLEYPHYNRPPVFRGMGVPEALRSGGHRAVRAWRRAPRPWNNCAKPPGWVERAPLTPEARQPFNQV